MRVEWSEELLGLLAECTPRQRAAIPRIVAALAGGRSLASLLRGKEKICAFNTYYRKPKGWHHQPRFQQALELAQDEYDRALLDRNVDETVQEMRRGCRLSAQLLVGEVIQGLQDQADDVDLSVRELGLVLLLRHESSSVRMEAADKLLRTSDRRRERAIKAALGLLDRADVKTAAKLPASGDEEARWREYIDELWELGGGGDGQALADVGAEDGGVPAGGVRTPAAPGAGAPKRGDGRGSRRG